MSVLYPPLVEQCFAYMVEENPQLSKADVYQLLKDEGIINEFGYPTEEALTRGIVKEYTEIEAMTFSEFLQVFPVFERYEPSCFKRIDGFWQMKNDLLRTIEDDYQHEVFSSEELDQLEAFFELRKTCHQF